MRRLVAPLAVVLLAASSCAQPGGGGGSPSASAADFAALAADVADAWAAAPARDAWRTGYVPLENPLKPTPTRCST